jgi:hypothetical protein
VLPGDTLPGTPGQTGTLARTTGGRSSASSQPPTPSPSARQEGPTTAELLGSTAESPKADGELPANLKKRAERKAAFANEWVNAYDPLPGNRCVTRLKMRTSVESRFHISHGNPRL